MKAITQNERYEFSKAKKVIASVVAAAMVVSFGNFALGGTSEALAEDGAVEVRFQVADGMTVTVGADQFNADEDAVYAAAIDTDLAFSVDAPEDMAVAVTYGVEGGDPVSRAMGSKQPSDNLIIGEPSLEDGSQDDPIASSPIEDDGEGAGNTAAPEEPTGDLEAPVEEVPSTEETVPTVDEAAPEGESAEVLSDRKLKRDYP